MQKQRATMIVEMFGIIDCRRPDGFVTKETASQLGIDPDAGWRMTNVETLIGSNGPGRTKVTLVRDVALDVITPDKWNETI